MTLNKMKKNKRKTALEEHEIISEQEVTEIVCYCTNTEIPYFFEQTFCIVENITINKITLVNHLQISMYAPTWK